MLQATIHITKADRQTLPDKNAVVGPGNQITFCKIFVSFLVNIKLGYINKQTLNIHPPIYRKTALSG